MSPLHLVRLSDMVQRGQEESRETLGGAKEEQEQRDISKKGGFAELANKGSLHNLIFIPLTVFIMLLINKVV